MKKLLCVSGVLIIIDQITKHIARHFVGDGLITVIPGNLFFNGSWDFIYLFNALIFDLKDFYILTQLALIYIFGIMLIPQYLKLSKEQRNQLKFFSWVKR